MSVLSYADNREIVNTIETIASEKNIKKEVFFDALESSFIQIAKDTFGDKYNFAVRIGRANGLVEFFRILNVVENVNNDFTEISLKDAKKLDQNTEIGKTVMEDMPTIEMTHDILHRIRKEISAVILDAEKQAEYEYFVKLQDKIVTGIIKSISSGGLLVLIDRFESFIPRKNLIFGEIDRLRIGQKITGVVDSVVRSNLQSQAVLSRTSGEFLRRLFENEIPEIYDGVIQIKAIAREAGSRSKVAVYSEDTSVDAVATCIGVRGKKIQNVTKEIGEEKIDIIAWNPDVATFLINSLKNIPIVNVTADHKTHTLDVVLASENISNAIGRRGQNVRLLSNLIGWTVHFMTEGENSQKRIKDFEECVAKLIDDLDVEEIIAQLLVAAGFSTTEIIANSDVYALSKIEGFNNDIAEAIHSRALEIHNVNLEQTYSKATEEIAEIKKVVEVSQQCEDLLKYMLTNNHTPQEIADFSIDDMLEEIDSAISIDNSVIANAIMACRKYCKMI